LIPLPRIQAAPAAGVPVTAVTPRSLRLRVRPAQVRVRLRIPASARIQALPSGLPRPLRLVTPGQVLPAAVLPADAPARIRLRVVFQKGGPVPARLVLPASLPGQARLRIQIPARARLTPALPAPPNW